MHRKFIAFLALFSVLLLQASSLSCRDRNDKDVAWFTWIKYPGHLTDTSMRYAYLDVNLESTYQIIYGSAMDTEGEAMPNTFKAINDISEEYINLLAFNDEPPGSDADSHNAHAKGIIAYDNDTDTGVFIMHSIPKFPTVSDSGEIDIEIPSTGLIYGQNGYCISINKEILGHLQTSIPLEVPHIYYSSGLFKNFEASLSAESAIVQFNLLNGDDQWLFTKNPKDASFLYDDMIGPYFDTDLAVESWGRPYQAASCPPGMTYSTVNIDTISFNDEDSWKHTNDHSKWGITVEDDVKLACLCDMNRMTSQQARGGSCLCTKNENLYGALLKIATTMDQCATEKKEETFSDFLNDLTSA